MNTPPGKGTSIRIPPSPLGINVYIAVISERGLDSIDRVLRQSSGNSPFATCDWMVSFNDWRHFDGQGFLLCSLLRAGAFVINDLRVPAPYSLGVTLKWARSVPVNTQPHARPARKIPTNAGSVAFAVEVFVTLAGLGPRRWTLDPITTAAVGYVARSSVPPHVLKPMNAPVSQ